jgi:glycine/D-amino acid oxidase-like deaminating enzyme
MRVAVVGAGLFGSTAAIHLARAGHDVHLIEKSGQILGAASTINQGRLHAGFHYPRSPRTIRECQAGLSSFLEEYGSAVVRDGEAYYAIAAEGSKTSCGEFLDVCIDHNLTFDLGCPHVNQDAVTLAVRADEGRIDPAQLLVAVTRNMREAGVKLRLFTEAKSNLRAAFDQIVIATYADTNEVAFSLGCPVEKLQYEVVEKPLLKLPAAMRNVGIVVMDGPFCSLDPWGQTGMHVMGHVEHAIHASYTGFDANVPAHIQPYLNKGIVECKEHTRVAEFIEAGKEFIPALADADYVGSMWTVRAVLPYRDHDDARPTLVTRLDEQTLRVFSGKLGTAVSAAMTVQQMLTPSHDRTDAPAELVA